MSIQSARNFPLHCDFRPLLENRLICLVSAVDCINLSVVLSTPTGLRLPFSLGARVRPRAFYSIFPRTVSSGHLAFPSCLDNIDPCMFIYLSVCHGGHIFPNLSFFGLDPLCFASHSINSKYQFQFLFAVW